MGIIVKKRYAKITKRGYKEKLGIKLKQGFKTQFRLYSAPKYKRKGRSNKKCAELPIHANFDFVFSRIIATNPRGRVKK